MIPLTDTLTALLPTREETLFLRAAVGGPLAEAAWAAWCATVGDRKLALQTERAGRKRLLPLLFHSLRHSSAPIDLELLPYLRTAYAREELRTRTYLRATGEILGHLAEVGIEPLVLRGPALACTVYAEPALRHSHDLDLLLDAAVAEDAARALLRGECREVPADPVSGAGVFEHPSGLRIQLHDHVLRLRVWRRTSADLCGRSQTFDLGGANARTLSAGDHLVHVCAQAACTPSRSSLQWVCDAAHLIRSGRVDWDLVLAFASETRTAAPLLVLLTYLRGDLQASIPETVASRLGEEAGRTDRSQGDAALFAARASGATFRALLSHSRSWQSRRHVLRWMALPSPAYLREARGIEPTAVPLYYAARPFRYVGRRWKRRRRGVPPPSVGAASRRDP